MGMSFLWCEDNLEHYVKECEETRGNFEELGKNEIVRNL